MFPRPQHTQLGCISVRLSSNTLLCYVSNTGERVFGSHACSNQEQRWLEGLLRRYNRHLYVSVVHVSRGVA